METEVWELQSQGFLSPTSQLHSPLLEEQEKTQGELDEKMERWVYLNDLAEKIAEQG